MATSFITTLLIPANAFAESSAANGRAMAEYGRDELRGLSGVATASSSIVQSRRRVARLLVLLADALLNNTLTTTHLLFASNLGHLQEMTDGRSTTSFKGR